MPSEASNNNIETRGMSLRFDYGFATCGAMLQRQVAVIIRLRASSGVSEVHANKLHGVAPVLSKVRCLPHPATTYLINW